jgi:hypothetical protein
MAKFKDQIMFEYLKLCKTFIFMAFKEKEIVRFQQIIFTTVPRLAVQTAILVQSSDRPAPKFQQEPEPNRN